MRKLSYSDKKTKSPADYLFHPKRESQEIKKKYSKLSPFMS